MGMLGPEFLARYDAGEMFASGDEMRADEDFGRVNKLIPVGSLKRQLPTLTRPSKSLVRRQFPLRAMVLTCDTGEVRIPATIQRRR